jgi:cation diffusion facilitator family transporter
VPGIKTSATILKSGERYSRIRKVLILVLVANFTVAAAKGVVGWQADSISMVSDAFHSLMDGLSNVIGLVGVHLAARPRDKSHTYGHAKFETFASVAIVILLLVTAVQIGESVYGRVTADDPATPDASALAFLTMGVTIVVNSAISFYERRQGKKLSSTFLVADSRHTLTDVYISFAVVGSLIAASFDMAVIDAVVGGAIALAIAYAALKIMREASFVLLDRAALDPDQISEICLEASIEGILDCHKVRTRGTEIGYWIDLHLLVEPELTTRESHKIASMVERRLKDAYGEETDVVIHIEPGR